MAIRPILLWPGLYASQRGNRTQYLLIWESFASRKPGTFSAVRTLMHSLCYQVVFLLLTTWVDFGEVVSLSWASVFPSVR